jgi:hypothetical protein
MTLESLREEITALVAKAADEASVGGEGQDDPTDWLEALSDGCCDGLDNAFARWEALDDENVGPVLDASVVDDDDEDDAA